MSKLDIEVVPMFVDMDGKVSVYIVDAYKDYKDELGEIDTKHVRFKVTKNDVEVYYGGDKWEKLNILTINRNIELTEETVIKLIEDWWKEKEFQEDPNNV